MSNSNTVALTSYLLDFYNNPKKVEEYKINFLKNNYFPTINNILNCSFEEFKIGISKYNNIIWFCNSANLDYQVMYDYKNDFYYIKEKGHKPYSINIENYINNKKRKRDIYNETNELCSSYLMPCNIA